MRFSHYRAALILAPVGFFLVMLTIAIGRSSPIPIEYSAHKHTQELVILCLTLCAVVYGYHAVQRRVLRAEVRQNAALHELEERYRLLAEHATDLVTVVNPEGRIRYASPSFLTVLGYDPVDIIGRHVCDLIHPDDAMTSCMHLGDGLHLSSARTTYRLRHANGTWSWIECSSFCHPYNGEMQLVWVGRDITERKRLEDDLLHMQKLDSLGRMAGAVIHDINNALTGIGGVTALGLQTLPPDHEIRADLEAIGHAADHVSTLACQLLSFARKPSFAPRALDLNELIHKLSYLLQRLLGADVTCIFELEPDLGRIKGDPAQLEQVILNLAVNARDAIPQGGSLSIETANVVLEHPEGNAQAKDRACPYVQLTISDTGTGMDVATQARIFERFFTTKEPGHGTGLGLPTCAEIIKQHGGAIQVDSAPGRGTVVTIYLPRLPEASIEHNSANIWIAF